MTYKEADRLILDAINDAETANYYGGQCESNQREYLVAATGRDVRKHPEFAGTFTGGIGI